MVHFRRARLAVMTKLFGEGPDQANEPSPSSPPAAERPPEPGSPWKNRVWDMVILALILIFIFLVYSIMVESA